MDTLKWLGAVFLAVLVVSVIVGGIFLITTFGVVLGAIALAATVIFFIAVLIKNMATAWYNKRKPRKQ